MAAIRFMKHFVTDGTTKARVFYSAGQICRKGELMECVTLYAKDYSGNLGKIFADKYENGTDIMTDYFEEGHVRIFPSDALYSAVMARVAANKAAR